MYKTSKLIASTNTNFELKNDSQTIVIDFVDNSDIDSLLLQLRSAGFYSGKTLSLHFEKMKGNNGLPNIDVYLNLDQEKRPKEKNFVGVIALYGLGESSTPSPEYDGSGQHLVFDVGEVFSKVRSQSNWSEKQFKLTLLPYHPLPPDAYLTIGCIDVYFYES